MNAGEVEPSSYDLLIRTGRLVCPMTGLDGPGAVAICGDRIAACGPDVQGPALQTLDFPDGILLPGLIDMHAHPAKSGSQWGVDPDEHCLPFGTTTVMSQGDAGADNFADYLRDTIETSRTGIRMAINLSRRGDPGPGGCLANLAWLDVDACVAAIEKYRAHVWGVSVNVSHHCCGPSDPQEVLQRGLLVAERTGLPLLFGLRRPEDWPLSEQFALLRPGDVVTYCYRRTPHCIVERGRVLPCVREARERGILFDIGHGTNSFDFATAEAALQDGFPPDTISTDLQQAHVSQSPRHDLPLIMSKLRAAGMDEQAIFRAVTIRPAEILRSDQEIGSLRVGSRADVTVLRWREGTEPLTDAFGNVRAGGRWEAAATVCGGRMMR